MSNRPKELYPRERNFDDASYRRVSISLEAQLLDKLARASRDSNESIASLARRILNEAVLSERATSSSLFVEKSSQLLQGEPVTESRRVAPYVFLSHNKADKRFVRNLSTRLQESGVRVWLDEAELKHGQSLIERLRDAIDEVDLLLAVISPASIQSRWVQREIDIAMNSEIKKRKIRVVPILRSGTTLPGFLEGKLYADFSSQYRSKRSFPKLLESIFHLTAP